MRIIIGFFLIYIVIGTTYSFSQVIDITDLLDSNQIVIIGEKTGDVKTAQYLTALVDEYTSDGQCLKVALEIGEDQQEKIDKSVKDKDALSALDIRGIYNAVSYQGIITNINKLIRIDRCVSIKAVGPPKTVPVESSPWIEKKIPELLKDQFPVLLVVKLKDSLKYYDWNSSGIGKPFLAERLVSKGYKVASVLNYWKEYYCKKDKVDTISSNDPNASTYVTKLIYSEVQFLPKEASTVADAINIWSCDIDEMAEAKKLIDEKEIKKALRQGRPIVGMNKEQVVKAVGQPLKKKEINDLTEKWEIYCAHDDGFDFHCYSVTFTGYIATKVRGY